MGKGSTSSSTPKPSAEEKLLRPPIVRRATDPGMVDSAQMARAMGTERLGRLNEPAPLDPRVAGILSFFMPQMTAARGMAGQTLSDFANAPGASPLGVGGSSFGTPVDFASMLTPEAVRGSFSEYTGDMAGTGPSPEFAEKTRGAGTRLSDEMINELLGEQTPGEQTQETIGRFGERFLKKKKNQDFWNAIFGVAGEDAQEGG